MKSSNRLILGSVMLTVGVSLLVFGFLLYIDTSGLNVLLYEANRHLFIFYYVLARILIIWGIALISAAVVLYLIVAIHKEFKSRKPMVMAVSVLLVGLSLSGFFVYAVFPPPVHSKVEIKPSDQYTEVGSQRSIVYNLSLYSNYRSVGYFNVSLNGDNVFDQSLGFTGYDNATYTVPSSTFSSPGNYTVSVSVVHGSSKKVSRSWIDVKPQSPMDVYISGPIDVTDGYTGNYSAHITGGYSPYRILWYISGQNSHRLSGDSISFTFGDYYYGYSIEALVTDAYGMENSSTIYAYIAPNLTASFSAEYTQLDQYMTDVFNSSTYSGFEQTGVGPYSYYWYENGNLFSTSENSTYQFQSAGTYNISLNVKDSENQVSMYSEDIKVNPQFGLWSYGPFPSQITGSESVNFWYNVTGGTWFQNVSGFGHYEVTFYVDGNGYIPDNSFFSGNIGHYEFALSSYVLNNGGNSFEVMAQDGVGQESDFSITVYYSS